MKNVLIIGMGEFGKQLANELRDDKVEVCIIDQDSSVINLMQTDYPNAFIGDCMQKQTLIELGVKNFDIVVVAIGSNFQASLEITSNLKELKAKYIISKAATDIQAKFLTMAGADEIVYPEKDTAKRIALKTSANNILDCFQINDDYCMFEIEVPEQWVGTSIKELNIRQKYDVNIIAVKHDDILNLPTPEYTFYNGDHLYIFGKNKSPLKMEKLNKR